MWNKFLLILFVGTFAFSLSAQQYRRYRSRRGRDRSTQTTTVQQTKTEEKTEKKTEKKTSSQQQSRKSERKTSSATGKFDPKKPLLTQKNIDSVIDDQIGKQLLECKISAKLPGRKTDEEDDAEDGEQKEANAKPGKTVFISRLDFSILMSRYKSLMTNFELTEVSHIPIEWYQQFNAELRKFESIVNEMTFALRIRADGRYAAAVQKFKAHQKVCLNFLKQKKPRISKEQYEALVLKNSKIRLQNYLKQQEEKRRAALQRQQEQFKKLQQKSQGNQKKPAQGAGN